MNNNKHMKLLGLKVRDAVTQYEGVVTSLSFDLYGCVQAVVTGPTQSDGKHTSGWYDVTRLTVLDARPVMELPDFEKGYIAEGKKGAAFKPEQ